jgi:hypothetical protein
MKSSQSREAPTLILVPRSFASLVRARELAASRGQSEGLSNGLGSDLYGHALTGRRRNGLPSFAQAFDVKPNGLSHLVGTLVGRGTGSDYTREVGTVGRIVGRLTAFDHDQIAAHACPPFGDSSVPPVSFLSPACLKMLASVLGCSSSLGFPATVTTPGFVGCRYCRCDPRVRV